MASNFATAKYKTGSGAAQELSGSIRKKEKKRTEQ